MLGNRGYSTVQMEAGITARKNLSLSYANGLGASGSTFYDNKVIEFFSPHAKQKETLIAIGVGIPSYQSKPGRVPTSQTNTRTNDKCISYKTS